MRVKLRSIEFDPDPRSLPGDPDSFAFLARLLVGPSDGPGEESFDLRICTPQWLARRARSEGVVDGRHHAIVNLDEFDPSVLREWLAKRVETVQAATWPEAAEIIARLAYWEFEDYRPYQA